MVDTFVAVKRAIKYGAVFLSALKGPAARARIGWAIRAHIGISWS